MQILERLLNNKGTVSSALGKPLAHRALAGDLKILDKCVEYSTYQINDKKMKHVRSGAAKAVEITAEHKPQLLKKHLPRLLPALEAEEPQTRWMIIRTMGFCAKVNPETARKAIPYAEDIIDEKEGLCIASSADLFLGDYGSLSARNAKQVFPLLEKSIGTCIENEQDWILEALLELYPVLGKREKETARRFANQSRDSSRNNTRKRVIKILGYDS